MFSAHSGAWGIDPHCQLGSWCCQSQDAAMRVLQPCEPYWCGKLGTEKQQQRHFTSIQVIFQGHLFSVPLWKRTEIQHFSLPLLWHIPCTQELAQHPTLLGNHCVCTLREELLGLASSMASPRHHPTLMCTPDAAHHSCQWLLYFISLCCCLPGSMGCSVLSFGYTVNGLTL